jgi:uncharacterized protein YjbI with pentapeptide repeats
VNTPQNLFEVLHDHALWIGSDGKTGVKADLQNTDLEELDLRGKDLRKINLRNANLTNANLADAHLEMAELQGANLAHAKIENADLSYADLSNVTGLISKQLGGCNLSGTKLPAAINIENPSSEFADLSHSTKTVFITMVLSVLMMSGSI